MSGEESRVPDNQMTQGMMLDLDAMVVHDLLNNDVTG